MASSGGTTFIQDEAGDAGLMGYIQHCLTAIVGFLITWLINTFFRMPPNAHHMDPRDVIVDLPPPPLVEPEPEPERGGFHRLPPHRPPTVEHEIVRLHLPPPPPPPPPPSQPSPLSRRFKIIIYSLDVLGAITVGYANGFMGGVMNTPIFLEYFFHAMLVKQNHEDSTNFCSFANPIFLALSSVVQFTSGVAVWPAYFLGRSYGTKPVLFCGASLLLIGVLCVVSPLHHETRWIIILGLVVIGSGTGFLAEVIPTILAESLPSGYQRFGSTLFGYQILGKVLGYGANYYVSYHIIWRLPFIVLGVLAFLILGVSFWVNETPQYLVRKQRPGRALAILRHNRDGWQDDEIDKEWGEINNTAHQEAQMSMSSEICSRHIRPILVIKVGSQLLPLLVGSAPVMFFGPLVTKSESSIMHEGVLTPLVGGVLGVIATLLASGVLHRFRTRRPLLIGSSLVILILQIGLWVIFTFHVDPLTNIKKSVSLWVTTLLIANAGSNNVLTNPHGWISCSVPGAAALLVSVSTRSLTALVTGGVTFMSIHLLCHLEGWVFMVGVCFSIILLVFQLFFVPETTGIDGSQIDDRVWRHHWFWRRYMS